MAFIDTSSVGKILSSRVVSTLTYPRGVDHYLAHFNPLWSMNEVRARVTNVHHHTADSVTLTLTPNTRWKGFIPGQYVRLSVEIDGVRRTRCYSPANSIHRADGQIELTIKAHPTGFVSRHLHRHATQDMIVTLSQAEGQFALPAERPERILLISGGSGITPVMSMLRTLCDEGHTGRITFLHYANSADAMIYADELAAIAQKHPNVELVRAFLADGGELQGYFSQAHLDARVPDFAEAQTFLCGPPAMMASVEALWRNAGISDRLHLEHFTAQAVASARDENAEGDVRFARSERIAVNTGTNLLEQAEAAGLTPESGCRMGICYSCTCKKTSGKVRDTRTGQISDAGEEDIQLCVSVPVGTVTLDL